jgi:hypothetical protein
VLSGNGSEIIYDDTISSIDDARSSDQSGDLYCKMLEPVGEYHEVAMNINVTAPGEYEFRAVDVTLPVTIYLDKIDLVLIKAFASFAEPVQMGEAFT